jgi:antitoxin component YwqK of YwqJK toxin-antitoxin module
VGAGKQHAGDRVSLMYIRKHAVCCIMLLSLMFFMFNHVGSAEAEKKPIQVLIDGHPLSFNLQPIIQDGTTLVPYRPIFEAFGLTVAWDANTRTVTGKDDSQQISIQIGSNKAMVNGREQSLPAAAQLISGSTFVPLRFISEATGRTINWNEAEQTISISPLPAKEKYEGNLLNGKRNGLGKLYMNGKLLYEGNFKDDLMDGQGKKYYPNGKLMYSGDFRIGKMDGEGKLYHEDGSLWYAAHFEQDSINGFGTVYFDYGYRLEVGLKDGNPEGKGTYYNGDNKVVFIGEFKNGMKNGFGTFYYDNGNKMNEGEFVNREMLSGKLYYETGELWYIGEFSDLKPDGQGIMYFKNGAVEFEGKFKAGEPLKSIN